MRTSEFEGAMEELGFTIEIDSYDEMHVNNSCGTVASVPKNKIYIIDTDWDDFENLGETGQSELFFTLTEYACTPISEREEEKRYQLELSLPILSNKTSKYLNYLVCVRRFVIHTQENTEIEKTIFTESELKTMDLTGFEKVEVTE